MLEEDRTATALRPYMCMPETEMDEFRAIFKVRGEGLLFVWIFFVFM